MPVPQSDHGVLLVPQKVDSKLVAFALATEGDPYYASGRFGRMLYLSATTITTLGLGDVTPISGMARLPVGLEALLGIVFIGLFLNNLAKIVSGRRSPSTSASHPTHDELIGPQIARGSHYGGQRTYGI